MEDREVISAFVDHLRNSVRPDLKITRWPEDENRSAPDIDAIAGPYAIEHTSIDTLPNQRRDSDWFKKAVGRIENELSKKMSFRLNIGIDYRAVTKGQDWNAIYLAMKYWIENKSLDLKDGFHVIRGILQIPFDLQVKKASHRPPGLFFKRIVQEDNTLPELINKQIDRKISKMVKYCKEGLTTVLLIETNDIALMNTALMIDAIGNAYPDGLPLTVSQVWYADTTSSRCIEFIDLTRDLCAK
jgi:hypothetical protein